MSDPCIHGGGPGGSEERPDPLRTSVLFDVCALGQTVRRLLLTTMADGPLRPEEYAVYSAIFELESLTPTAMGARLGMPLTTVMDHVRTLEARGHLRRLPNPRDGRSYLVTLTAAGLAAHRDASRRFEVAYAAFVETLPGGETRAQAQLAEIRAAAEAATRGLATVPRSRSAGARTSRPAAGPAGKRRPQPHARRCPPRS